MNAQYLGVYSAEQARRHHVKPGITGLAQISGRNTVTWEEKFWLDVHYADHVTLLLDIRILLLETVFKVLRRDTVGPDGDLDVPLFTGSRTREERATADRDGVPAANSNRPATTEPT